MLSFVRLAARAIPLVTVVTPGSTTVSTDGNAATLISTTATVENIGDIDPGIRLDTGDVITTITAVTPSVATVTGSAIAWVSDGLAYFKVMVGGLWQYVSIAVSRQTSVTTNSFTGWRPGTLAKAMADAVDNALAGKTASSTTLNLFSTRNDATGTYVYNTSLWCGEVDFSFLAVNANAFRLDTIGHDICGCAAHYAPGVGGVLKFVAPNGTVYSGTVATAPARVAGTDFAIFRLSAPLNAAIAGIKIMPANWLTYVGPLTYRPPVLFTNQFRMLHVSDLTSDDGGTLRLSDPTDAQRLAFSTGAIPGDSGDPIMALVGTTPVLFTEFFTASGGPDDGANITAVNTTIAATGATGTAGVLDVSAYTAHN